jgi:phage antirepressor YoqD-like protein
MSLAVLRHQDHYKAAARELRDAGLSWREELGGKHARLVIYVNGREEVETLSISPSDWRTAKEVRARFRRRIRQWKAEAVASLATETAPAEFPTLEKRTMDSSHISAMASSDTLTMSSREIADLCGKDHKHVLRDARRMLVELGESESGYAHSWTNPQNGQQYAELRLPKNLTMTLVTGYSIPLRKRVVDRLEELERREAPEVQIDAMLNDPTKLRALLLDNVEMRLVLEAELEEAKPVVAAYEHLTRSDGSFCVTDAAKVLDMRPKDLFDLLASKRWLYRRPGNGHWVGYQDKVQQGLVDHRVHEVTKSDGSSRITEQARITAKGMAALGKMVAPV